MLDIDTEDDDFFADLVGYLISEFDKAIGGCYSFRYSELSYKAVSQLDFLSSRFYEYVRLGDIRGKIFIV